MTSAGHVREPHHEMVFPQSARSFVRLMNRLWRVEGTEIDGDESRATVHLTQKFNGLNALIGWIEGFLLWSVYRCRDQESTICASASIGVRAERRHHSQVCGAHTNTNARNNSLFSFRLNMSVSFLLAFPE